MDHQRAVLPSLMPPSHALDNGCNIWLTTASESAARISAAEDKAMDRSIPSSKKALPVGLSVRNGPVTDDGMDIDGPLHVNGNAKRKSRTSISKVTSYRDASDDSDDGAPLVGNISRHARDALSRRDADKSQ